MLVVKCFHVSMEKCDTYIRMNIYKLYAIYGKISHSILF